MNSTVQCNRFSDEKIGDGRVQSESESEDCSILFKILLLVRTTPESSVRNLTHKKKQIPDSFHCRAGKLELMQFQIYCDRPKCWRVIECNYQKCNVRKNPYLRLFLSPPVFVQHRQRTHRIAGCWWVG